jgi:hypothetical protein
MSGRDVRIDGDAIGNIIQTGDHNTAELRFKKVQLPPPEKVDIRAELETLKQLLGQLKTEDQQKIVNAVSEAAGDATKPNPDVDQAAKAMKDAEIEAEIEDFLEGLNQPTYRGMRVNGVRVHTWSSQKGMSGL